MSRTKKIAIYATMIVVWPFVLAASWFLPDAGQTRSESVAEFRAAWKAEWDRQRQS